MAPAKLRSFANDLLAAPSLLRRRDQRLCMAAERMSTSRTRGELRRKPTAARSQSTALWSLAFGERARRPADALFTAGRTTRWTGSSDSIARANTSSRARPQSRPCVFVRPRIGPRLVAPSLATAWGPILLRTRALSAQRLDGDGGRNREDLRGPPVAVCRLVGPHLLSGSRNTMPVCPDGDPDDVEIVCEPPPEI